MFEVQRFADNQWQNCVTTLEDKPVKFDTKEDAEKSLKGFLKFMVEGQFRVFEI